MTVCPASTKTWTMREAMDGYATSQRSPTRRSRRQELTHRRPRAAGCCCLVSSADESHPSWLPDLYCSHKLLARVEEVEFLALGGVRARVSDNVDEGELLAEQGGDGGAC
jgi:hypothetical protein